MKREGIANVCDVTDHHIQNARGESSFFVGFCQQ
jgi:hypothetical protein